MHFYHCLTVDPLVSLLLGFTFVPRSVSTSTLVLSTPTLYLTSPPTFNMAHTGHPSDLSDDCGSDGEYQPGWDAESDTDLDDPSTENLDSEELQPKSSQAQAQVVENQIHQFEEEGSYVSALGDDEPLFDGNRKPVEHYKRRLQDLNEEAYDHKEYAPGTEMTIRKTQERWAEWVSLPLPDILLALTQPF